MYFTDAHEELRMHIRRFLEKEVQPHLEEWEEKTFPDSIFQRFGELGFLGLRYPPEYGGQGGDYFSALVLSEELARAGTGGLGMAVAVQTEMATPPVFKFGTEEQKTRWLAPAIRGEQIARSPSPSPMRARMWQASRRWLGDLKTSSSSAGARPSSPTVRAVT